MTPVSPDYLAALERSLADATERAERAERARDEWKACAASYETLIQAIRAALGAMPHETTEAAAKRAASVLEEWSEQEALIESVCPILEDIHEKGSPWASRRAGEALAALGISEAAPGTESRP